MCNRVSWWACRVNSCSTRDSWLCSHLRPPSSIFLSRFLFFHVLLCWLVTSWDPSPLNWACLAHVASPTFCYKKSRLLNLFTLLNKKCPMKQLKQLFWSFLLQHESYFQIVKQKYSLCIKYSNCVTMKTRLQNERKKCQHQWILLIFSSTFSFYSTSTRSQFTVLLLKGGNKQYNRVKLLIHIKLCAFLSLFCIKHQLFQFWKDSAC